MHNTIKWIHVLFFPVSLVICLVMAGNGGWVGYATITNRPGMNGHLYVYYDMARTLFLAYNFFNAAISIGFIFFMTKYIEMADRRPLVRSYKYLLLFIGYVVVADFYMQMRYVGKG